MKKPSKREIAIKDVLIVGHRDSSLINLGYNKAYYDWEAYHQWDIEEICIEHCKELEEIEKDLPSEFKLLEIILEWKYPDGLALLPNSRKGATLMDVYPKEYELAKVISKRIRGDV